ncbi:MAG: prepilin-type N-terminal cleavage/methylation domain-containing protein [Nitrososphaerales archaeon]
MSRLKRDESGISLVEVAIAMALFAIVIVSVDASVTVLNSRTNNLSQASQGIDQLQLAEQAVVTDLHSAMGFYTQSGCSSANAYAGSPATTLSSPFYFQSDLDGSQKCITVTLSSSSHTLTVTSGSTNSISVSNLDPGASISVTCTTTAVDGTYYCTNASVHLTMDSPRTGAPHEITTTMADSRIEIWTQEYECVDAGGTTC